MPRNLEIKARILNLKEARRTALRIGARYAGTLHQSDTYFNVMNGRLKLRETKRGRSELVQYVRPEKTNERISNFRRYACTEPAMLKALLADSLGVLGLVRKRRLLYMYLETRIHLDEVSGLGTFMELETPVTKTLAEARKVNRELVKEFGVRKNDYIRHSYLDMTLVSKKGHGKGRVNR